MFILALRTRRLPSLGLCTTRQEVWAADRIKTLKETRHIMLSGKNIVFSSPSLPRHRLFLCSRANTNYIIY